MLEINMIINNSSNHESVQLLTKTIEKINGAYSPATIRAYRVDFGEFIKFCDGLEKCALPAQPHSVVDFIIKLTNSGRSSASIRSKVDFPQPDGPRIEMKSPICV